MKQGLVKVFKYYYGNCETIEAAIEYQTKARTKGFKGAFVVAFHKGKRITLQKARKLRLVTSLKIIFLKFIKINQ